MGTPVINSHLERFGLKTHVGTVAKPSKTEFMDIPPHRNDAIDAADLAPSKADDEGGESILSNEGLHELPTLQI